MVVKDVVSYREVDRKTSMSVPMITIQLTSMALHSSLSVVRELNLAGSKSFFGDFSAKSMPHQVEASKEV